MKITIILCCFLLLMPVSCYPVRYDGPYKGRIIDAETGQPIEGVVVLGVWYKETPTVAGAVSSYYDAMETTTDINGDFKISGLGLKILSNVAPMDVLIFKTGYEYIGLGPWDSFKEDEILKNKVRWEEGKVIVPLRKLKMEERKKQGIPDIHYEERTEGGITHLYTPKNIKLLIREVNKELLEQGLKPLEGE